MTFLLINNCAETDFKHTRTMLRELKGTSFKNNELAID